MRRRLLRLICACVPTVRFESLFALVIIGHGRRQLLWFAVTRHPTAEWLAQQIVEAFPWETAPAYLVRDNDGAYGQVFRRRVRAMGMRPTDLTAITVAEPIRGTPDRNASARLPGSRCHLRRAASPADPGRIYRLLQSDADASVVEQGCAVRSRGPATGSHSRCADFVRAASLLRADMIFGKDKLLAEKIEASLVQSDRACIRSEIFRSSKQPPPGSPAGARNCFFVLPQPESAPYVV